MGGTKRVMRQSWDGRSGKNEVAERLNERKTGWSQMGE